MKKYILLGVLSLLFVGQAHGQTVVPDINSLNATLLQTLETLVAQLTAQLQALLAAQTSSTTIPASTAIQVAPFVPSVDIDAYYSKRAYYIDQLSHPTDFMSEPDLNLQGNVNAQYGVVSSAVRSQYIGWTHSQLNTLDAAYNCQFGRNYNILTGKECDDTKPLNSVTADLKARMVEINYELSGLNVNVGHMNAVGAADIMSKVTALKTELAQLNDQVGQ